MAFTCTRALDFARVSTTLVELHKFNALMAQMICSQVLEVLDQFFISTSYLCITCIISTSYPYLIAVFLPLITIHSIPYSKSSTLVQPPFAVFVDNSYDIALPLLISK